MGSNGFPPNWPVGLRVLIVDHDTLSLKQLANLLKRSKYEVFKCRSTTEARNKLKEETEKDNFEIVMCNPNMEGNEGFIFLKFVARQLDIPVIMMSNDESVSNVTKGIELGACHYLLKPITFKDVEHIWQHAYRKREPRIEGEEGSPLSESGLAVANGELSDNNQSGSSSKKSRAVWTEELNSMFEKAVAQIKREGGRAGPKRILELMNEPNRTNLTREQVASHLQKHRGKNPHEMTDAKQSSLTREQTESSVAFPPQVYNTNDHHQNMQQMRINGCTRVDQNMPGIRIDGYNNYRYLLATNFNPIPGFINQQPNNGHQFDQSFHHLNSGGGFNDEILGPNMNEQNAGVFNAPQQNLNPMFNAPLNLNLNPMFSALQNLPNLAPDHSASLPDNGFPFLSQ